MSQSTAWSDISEKLKRAPPLTGEDLQRFSAADLDPYTTQLAQVLCSRYAFAPLGYRNVTNVFSHLPGEVTEATNFEVGYGSKHVLHSILKTQDGVVLAAIIGVLSESFREDFVIDFMLALAKRSDVPPALRPLENQWQRLVRVLQGVLSISDIGHLVMILEQKLPDSDGDLELDVIIDALDKMSLAVKHRKQAFEIRCGSEQIFLAAVATWLFDLKYDVIDPAKPSVTHQEQPVDIVLNCSRASDPSLGPDAPDEMPPRYHYSIDQYSAGGRVPFDRLFKLSLGRTFSRIKDEILAGYLATISNVVIDSMEESERDRQFLFKRHDPNSSENPGAALVETMMAWFPELQRLAPRLSRYTSLGHSESKVKFVEAFESLRRSCQCSLCDSEAYEQDERCRITICETIMSMGLYIARMIVSPKLHPKARGVITVYDQLYKGRIPKIQENDPVEDFMDRIGRRLPNYVEMLKAGALLFAYSVSREIQVEQNLMGISHAGLSLYLNGSLIASRENESSDRSRSTVTVRITPGWLCLFGHEANLEVYDPAFMGWSYEESWQHIGDGIEYVQIMKWRGRVMLTSSVPKDEKHETLAESEGWIVYRHVP